MSALSKLSLGAAQFGLDYGVANKVGQVSLGEGQCILSVAKANNIDLLDTAIAYGNSEEVLGKMAVNEFRVVTKLPSLLEDQSNVAHWVSEQVRESLARLGKKNSMDCCYIVRKICRGRKV